MFASNPFYMKIDGPYALFTDPLNKGLGEKVSYIVPTMQALKGIVEAVYWKPTLYYLIDEVKGFFVKFWGAKVSMHSWRGHALNTVRVLFRCVC